MKITVFTPTYNRGYILQKAYDSLCRQTIKDFEWIIIDDGSEDNTNEIVMSWMQKENGFSIVYKKVTNGGKMRAVNKGLQLAQGELFLNLDSDDYLTDNAIEKILKWEKTVSDKKNKFAGIAGRRCHFDGSPIGTSFKGKYLDATVMEREKNGIMGDKVEIFYTDLFRRHLFPEIPGEKFISEGTTWMEICYEEGRVLRWFNEDIYCCEYIKDGYTNNSTELLLKNPKGVCLNIRKEIKYTNPSYIKKMKLWHKYIWCARKLNMSRNMICANLGISNIDYWSVLFGKQIIKILRKILR